MIQRNHRPTSWMQAMADSREYKAIGARSFFIYFHREKAMPYQFNQYWGHFYRNLTNFIFSNHSADE